jgi:hypothetical protein
MTDPTEDIVETHLRAWNAPAGSDRDAAIAAVYSPEVFVGEPGKALSGHRGVAEAIAALQAMARGSTLTRTGPIQTAQDLVTYTWSLGSDGSPAVASGRDVLIVRAGRITSLYVVIDEP